MCCYTRHDERFKLIKFILTLKFSLPFKCVVTIQQAVFISFYLFAICSLLSIANDVKFLAVTYTLTTLKVQVILDNILIFVFLNYGQKQLKIIIIQHCV